MNNKLKIIFNCIVLTGMIILFSRCKTGIHNEPDQQSDTTFIATNRIPVDTIIPDEILNNEIVQENTISPDLLKSIRANFKRINLITSWTTVDTTELYDSTEGGEAIYYYQNKKLEKFITRHFGEMGQLLTEYYMMDGQLSFVYENQTKYNRPIYYDASEMRENNDTEYFDADKSVIIETRNYFAEGKLTYQIRSQNNPAAVSLSEENKRIQSKYKNLIKQSK